MTDHDRRLIEAAEATGHDRRLAEAAASAEQFWTDHRADLDAFTAAMDTELRRAP